MSLVLVTDDSPSNREFLATIMGHEGWEVMEAGDGLEALAMAIQRTPDLVLLDIQMPAADGYTTVAAMRQHPTLAGTPIFAITAYAMEGDLQRGLDAGFTGYLTKPLTRQRLLAAIGALS